MENAKDKEPDKRVSIFDKRTERYWGNGLYHCTVGDREYLMRYESAEYPGNGGEFIIEEDGLDIDHYD
jgi:hypothetical protein